MLIQIQYSAGPQEWNKLPIYIRKNSSLSIFKTLFFCILSVYMYSLLNLFGYWTLNKHYYYYSNISLTYLLEGLWVYKRH